MLTFRLQKQFCLKWTKAATATATERANQKEMRKPFALRVHRGRFDVLPSRLLRHAVNAKSGAFSDSHVTFAVTSSQSRDLAPAGRHQGRSDGGYMGI